MNNTITKCLDNDWVHKGIRVVRAKQNRAVTRDSFQSVGLAPAVEDPHHGYTKSTPSPLQQAGVANLRHAVIDSVGTGHVRTEWSGHA
jgi:hypothetical protein